MRSTNSGDEQNDNFSYLLNKFDACKTKKDWEALIEESKTKNITFRQAEAIHARCKNSIAGTYGVTKRPEHYSHTKTS